MIFFLWKSKFLLVPEINGWDDAKARVKLALCMKGRAAFAKYAEIEDAKKDTLAHALEALTEILSIGPSRCKEGRISQLHEKNRGNYHQ